MFIKLVKKTINALPSYFICGFRQMEGQNTSATSLIEYWEQRAKKYGRRSALNISHSDEEYELITEQQKHEIFPYLSQSLKGDEKIILDFGCGPGRFTVDLALMIGGQAIGVDPINSFLEVAPKHPDVDYKQLEQGKILLPDCSVDIVWICLVLGGINYQALETTVHEIMRVLKNDGLLFLVENTSDKRSKSHWFFRRVSDYQALFPSVALVHLHDYFDLNERISIMSGRKV
jgi:ubiquinone/menaquinone biosynthesis C-methylase UbiE